MAAPAKRSAPRRRRDLARLALAALLITAGLAHLSWARTSFLAQVPDWTPADPDMVVLLSGGVEIALGLGLILFRRRWMGWIVGGFFVAVFPGNIAQLVNHRDAFGLDSDTRRALRLLLQPALVAWAVWSTGQPDPRPASPEDPSPGRGPRPTPLDAGPRA